MKNTFKDSIKSALENDILTGALGRFSEAYRVARAKAYEGIDFEALRTQIATAKSYAAEHQEELAAEFARHATAQGATVVRANSAEEVKDYILSLCQQRGVRHIAKSKSMATEEIHLNAHLQAHGIEVTETDLGEWILQLCGQRPSHMVLPAIHMTKEQVAEIFSKEVDERLQADIPALVKLARRELREKFLHADMGISGANIAVAETGSLVIVTNEGNARLVTSLPKIHVAVVGLEKLVAKFEDIAPILTALPRSATNQLMTSYVSFLNGPMVEADGAAKELHIVLMNNRRTEMAHDAKFKQALQCIRCASCLNVCPVFRLVGGHAFGKVYTGGIGTILTAWFDALKEADEIQSLCIQCGNCTEVCPGKIDIPGLILELRRRLAVEQGQPLVQKAIFSVVNNRRAFHALLRTASLAQKPFAKQGYIRHLPMFLSELTNARSLPAIAAQPLRDLVRRIEQPKGGPKAAFFAGCLIDFAYTEVGEAVIKVLNRAGIEVLFPEGQTCCGAPARYCGAYEVAAQNARDNIAALLEQDVDYIVSACPTCTVALQREFLATFESLGQTDRLAAAQKVAAKSFDFSTLVQKLCDEGRLKFKTGHQPSTLTYHDSCHLKRTLHAEQTSRALLRAASFEIHEMYESDMCCGMGGSYSIKMPEISAPILQRKLYNIAATGAELVVADCPGCVMQIGGGLDKAHSSVRARHIAQCLLEMLE